ncbi:MAG: isoprenylcysteine carboxylmethyltransferase family protein [Alphaproteobacteria bacterium]|nr:isoprenylcysteine carboxylmethyltransferase family protein [Alphaproteobacteria bacterium]
MRLTPVQGTILFFFLAPGTVAGLIPWAITGWTFEPAFLGNDATRFAGAALVFAALDIVIDSFARFAVTGKGTPSPTNPTETLVVEGFYRHVRNPMYVAVLTAILGQAVLFGSDHLLVYAAAVFAVFHAFIVLYEEPTLARTFPDAFKAYRAAVPRWLPRLTPWQPSQE